MNNKIEIYLDAVENMYVSVTFCLGLADTFLFVTSL